MLANCLKQRGKVCVVGYGLSFEAGAPHFYDILTGVWSKKPGQIDPFCAGAGRAAVLEWFAWRLHLISRIAKPGPFRALKVFQESYSLTVISQCVDGLARFNGIQDLIEPHGNAFGNRCAGCDFTEPAAIKAPPDKHAYQACPNCGEPLFPDVTMFGWNRKQNLLDKANSACCKAGLIIKIGADTSLAPLGPDPIALDGVPALTIEKGSLAFQDRGTRFSGSVQDLAEEVEQLTGKRLSAQDHVTHSGTLNFLLSLLNTTDSCSGKD